MSTQNNIPTPQDKNETVSWWEELINLIENKYGMSLQDAAAKTGKFSQESKSHFADIASSTDQAMKIVSKSIDDTSNDLDEKTSSLDRRLSAWGKTLSGLTNIAAGAGLTYMGWRGFGVPGGGVAVTVQSPSGWSSKR